MAATVADIVAVLPDAYAFISPFKMTLSIDALDSFFCLAILKNANDLHL